MCLGPTAIAAHKLDFGKQLVILGVCIDIKPSGVSCWPSADKVSKWLNRIELALLSCKHSPGEASKLSGALMWATQAIFKRLGRAMLRPIIRQSHGMKSSIGKELRIALEWWCEVLKMGIRCQCSFGTIARPVCCTSLLLAGKRDPGIRCRNGPFTCTLTPGVLHPEWQQCCSGECSCPHMCFKVESVCHDIEGWIYLLCGSGTLARGTGAVQFRRRQGNHVSRALVHRTR